MTDDDDIFILAPSMLLPIEEGKAVGTARKSELLMLKDFYTNRAYHPNVLSHARKVGQTVGRRKLLEVQDRTRDSLIGIINDYQRGRIDEKRLRERMTNTMRSAWRNVFLAGVRAGGHPGEGAGPGKTLVEIDVGDDYWFKTAVAHEMRFLNKFIQAIVEGTWRMPLERRAQMYVDTLSSFYESARVIALPEGVVIHWTGPNDDRTCPGCKYLFDHSPYTKFNLPTTPRAGLTPCLSNCRDKLFIRRAVEDEVRAVESAARYTRDQHIRHLRRIKRRGKH